MIGKKLSLKVHNVTVAGFLIYRQATARLRTIPNTFIIGAPRSGTTSLYNYLATHTDCLPSGAKEAYILQELPNLKYHMLEENAFLKKMWGRYDEQLSAYRKFYPLLYSVKKFIQKKGYNPIIVDATPDYFYSKDALDRIKKHFGNSKIIVLLRNPVERAYSDYILNANDYPIKDSRTFEEAINQEISAGIKSIHNYSYLYKSIYYPHIQYALKLFKKNEIAFIKTENFLRNTTTIMNEICTFLQISPPDTSSYYIHNKTEKKIPLSKHSSDKLKEIFQKPNQQLYQLLGKDFQW